MGGAGACVAASDGADGPPAPGPPAAPAPRPAEPAQPPGDHVFPMSLAPVLDDPGRDNIAIDRRYDMIHLRIQDAGDAHGIAFLDMAIEELPSDGTTHQVATGVHK